MDGALATFDRSIPLTTVNGATPKRLLLVSHPAP
jgi:hypothetical protein